VFLIARTGNHVTVTLHGELDYANTPQTRTTLRTAVLFAKDVTVDLAAVTFMDCATVNELTWAARLARGRGGTLTLANPQGTPRRILTILGIPFQENKRETADDQL